MLLGPLSSSGFQRCSPDHSIGRHVDAFIPVPIIELLDLGDQVLSIDFQHEADMIFKSLAARFDGDCSVRANNIILAAAHPQELDDRTCGCRMDCLSE